MLKLFKGRRSKKAERQEVQNGRHPPDGSTTPHAMSETPACDAETLIAPELSQPQNLSVAASVDRNDTTKAASSSVTEPQAPSNPPVTVNAQQAPAALAGSRSPAFFDQSSTTSLSWCEPSRARVYVP
jgi:hypothetical protein